MLENIFYHLRYDHNLFPTDIKYIFTGNCQINLSFPFFSLSVTFICFHSHEIGLKTSRAQTILEVETYSGRTSL